ncbi:MAG: hypothetical protein A3F12_06445 [Gammaproteobacteria bacterium RIFCSPHIGHO2_12_FULL_38_14]|nr:MAG: hypothetical protein A3F12_06445 [Gammaproteobacteria bacterium RIFCSPHIGHO2_12_FULL_38_14]
MLRNIFANLFSSNNPPTKKQKPDSEAKNESKPLLNGSTAQTLGAFIGGGEKPSESDDGPTVQSNVNTTGTDRFLQELTTIQDAWQKILSSWQSFLAKLTAENPLPRNYDAISTVQKHTSFVDAVGNLMKTALKDIKEGLEPANWELDDVLKNTEAKINDTHQLILTNCKALEETQNRDEQLTKAFQLSYAVIREVNILMAMIEEVKTELKECLQEMKIGEELLFGALKMLSIFLSKSPLQWLKISCDPSGLIETSYENHLYSEVTDEKSDIEIFNAEEIGTMKGVLEKANAVISNRAKGTPSNDLQYAANRGVTSYGKPLMPVVNPEQTVQNRVTLG